MKDLGLFCEYCLIVFIIAVPIAILLAYLFPNKNDNGLRHIT